MRPLLDWNSQKYRETGLQGSLYGQTLRYNIRGEAEAA